METGIQENAEVVEASVGYGHGQTWISVNQIAGFFDH